MQTNLNYQRQLAESLVTGLGVEAAMDFARRNEWDGVLAHICLSGAGSGMHGRLFAGTTPRERHRGVARCTRGGPLDGIVAWD